MSVKDTAPQLVSYFENQTRAFLEIQNGCNHRCTFCIIPFGRGNSRSVAFGEIVAQVKKMVAAGHQEVVLTGVDISGYGEDLAVPITLSKMIKRLLKLVPELPRLRLSSIDVAEIDEEFFDILQNEPRFTPYLHLSIQSGDDVILKRMKRRHSSAQVLEFCAKARQIRPEITFGCDIIAGFPTESEEMFLNSLKLISQAGIIFTHIFPYSKRDGTPAAKMPQLNGKIIKERARILREAGHAQLQNFLPTQVGQELAVLVEKNGRGKTENFLDVKILGGEKLKAGQILRLKITGFETNILTATI
jgi:threonylcarbamoyladenosine tRNA methylthiotransferase MtaB